MTDNPCCLQPQQLSERIEEWRLLAPAVLGREQTAAGARLRFRVEPGLTDKVVELVHLVEAERQCCPALTFSLELTLDVHAPEELRGWVVDTFGLNAERAGHGAQEPRARMTETDSFAPKAERTTAGDDPEGIEEAVRRHYAAVAEGGSCCTSTTGCGSAAEFAGIGSSGYPDAELEGLPGSALAASAGCANPVAVAELAPGEKVLDLGSGGGIDVLLSARRVGPTGKAYGLDMTDEMLALAERNKAAAGADNVEFLKGRIEAIPLPAATVDVVVSNCVIALSTDKAAVFSEAHRVLKPGGRLALADVVADVEPPPDGSPDVAEWVACAAGALTREQYRAGLSAAGFGAVSLTDSHQVADGFTSVIVSAVKTERQVPR